MNNKILIVDDEPMIVKMYRALFQYQGYTVAGTASSGEDAIELALTKNPDLIIMDINLQGGITGIEAAREIKNKCDIPIIYVTGNRDEMTKKLAMETFPAAYLMKPLNIIEFSLYIKNILANRHHFVSHPVL